MAEDEGVPINERRVSYLPGDQVLVEIGFFRHEMNLKEVFVACEHEESHKPFEVTLMGRPEEAEPLSGGVKFSRDKRIAGGCVLTAWWIEEGPRRGS
jgi:hypothetical protein